jgi:hypothetical protein
MSVDVIRYSGDLRLATAVGGTITLDTGPTTGTVVLTGNLTVLGVQTYITSTNLLIQDNIIVLNKGETGTSVTLGETAGSYGQSGIVIDRGNNASTATRASIIFEERTWSSTATTTTQYQGVWAIKNANKSAAIEVGAIRLGGGVAGGPNNDGRLNLLGVGQNQMLSVKGQSLNVGQEYYRRVIDNDDIPNKQYIDYRLSTGTVTTATNALGLRVGNTWIALEDDSVTGYDSRIRMAVDDAVQLTMYNGYSILGSLLFSGNTIRPSASNVNLVLQTLGTGTVVVNNGISIGVSSGDPGPETGKVKIWTTSTVGAGSTGIRYSGFEDITGSVPTSGELISARKALVLAIIF